MSNQDSDNQKPVSHFARLMSDMSEQKSSDDGKKHSDNEPKRNSIGGGRGQRLQLVVSTIEIVLK